MEQWPKGRPPQLQFTMYKENLTTTQVRSQAPDLYEYTLCRGGWSLGLLRL